MGSNRNIAVIGLGYVGLPVAIAFAKKFPGTIAFDISKKRVEELRQGIDETGEVSPAELLSCGARYTAEAEDLSGADFFVVAVPTPVDADKRPDLGALIHASEIVAKVLRPGGIVVYESTVYPGVTEEVCGPVLAVMSGLKQGVDFTLGYSPERINPGDLTHTLERIVKVVSGENSKTLETVAEVYGAIITAGVYRASSIKVAEAAKVIENTQRDLNIALMNELAIIFDRMGISTKEVLDAAATKWNFLRFSPGLVGGHCIGVDPYYLTTKAEQLGYRPQVILAGRRINDGMGQFIAQRTIKLMTNAGLKIKGARVGVLGLTFKEDVRDLRNSRVPTIIQELKEFGIVPLVHDPLVDPELAAEEYGLAVCAWEDLSDLDALIFAVSHQAFCQLPIKKLLTPLKSGGVLVDIKSVIDRAAVPPEFVHWQL